MVNDIEVNIHHLERRIERIEEQALALFAEHASLSRAFEHLSSVEGIGDRSGIKLLSELVMMPADLTVRHG